MKKVAMLKMYPQLSQTPIHRDLMSVIIAGCSRRTRARTWKIIPEPVQSFMLVAACGSIRQDGLSVPFEERTNMYLYLVYILLGLSVGILVGFMGVGGGIILVPAMVYLLHMTQHTAQGTSLFLQLPPLGLGALLMYLKKGNVDLAVGAICALGFLLGGYFGSRIAIGLPSAILRQWFGLFLI